MNITSHNQEVFDALKASGIIKKIIKKLSDTILSRLSLTEADLTNFELSAPIVHEEFVGPYDGIHSGYFTSVDCVASYQVKSDAEVDTDTWIEIAQSTDYEVTNRSYPAGSIANFPELEGHVTVYAGIPSSDEVALSFSFKFRLNN